MTDDTITQFKNELNSFFVLGLLNMAFGAMVMAFGMQYALSSLVGLNGVQPSVIFRAFTGIFSLICFGLGLMWVVSSAKILKGITKVRREYRKRTEPISNEILTSWIVRLMVHYRENKKTIQWMTLICVAGGVAFLVLGILNIFQGIGAGDSRTLIISLIAAAINLIIGIVSLRFFLYFRKYSSAWDRRLEEVTRSEETLQNSMESR